MSFLSDCDAKRTTSRSQLYKCATKRGKVSSIIPSVSLRGIGNGRVRFFQDSDSDSAGGVKMNILSSSRRDLCSARLLNSRCSTGAAQPPLVDSCGPESV